MKVLVVSTIALIIWFIAMFAIAVDNYNKSIHYSDLEQIINHMNSMDSCGYVKKIEIENRIRETMKYYHLEKNEVIKPYGKM